MGRPYTSVIAGAVAWSRLLVTYLTAFIFAKVRPLTGKERPEFLLRARAGSADVPLEVAGVSFTSSSAARANFSSACFPMAP